MADIKVNFYSRGTNDVLVLDKKWIKNIESLIQSTSQPDSVFYGSIEGVGSLEILDRDGTIIDLVRQGFFQDAVVEITINGTLLQKHIIKDSDFNVLENVLKIELGDVLSLLSSLTFDGYPYPVGDIETAKRSAFDVLFLVLYKFHQTIHQDFSEDVFLEMLDGQSVYGSVANLLRNTIIKYPYVPKNKTYREVVDWICQLCQLNVFADRLNRLKFATARPLSFNNEQVIISAKNTLNPLESSPITKNKYEYVQLNVTSVKDVVEANKNVSQIERSILGNEINFSMSLNEMNEGWNRDVVLSTGSALGSVIIPYAISAIKAKNYYVSGYAEIPFSDVDNIKQIKNIYPVLYSDSLSLVSIEYSREKIPVSAKIDRVSGSFQFSEYSEGSIEEVESDSGFFEQELSFSTEFAEANLVATATVNVEDTANIKVEKDKEGRKFIIHYHILVGRDEVMIGGTGKANDITNNPIPLSGYKYTYKPKRATISLMGEQREISFEEATKTNNKSDGNNINSVVLPSNPLIQSSCVFINNLGEETSVPASIVSSVRNDYRNGIAKGKATIICGNYYNQKGDIIKNWENGEVVSVGDILRFDSNNKFVGDCLWRVTGSQFKKKGVPVVDVELQEVVKNVDLANGYWYNTKSPAQSGALTLGFNFEQYKKPYAQKNEQYKNSWSYVIRGFAGDETIEEEVSVVYFDGGTLVLKNETCNYIGISSEFFRYKFESFEEPIIQGDEIVGYNTVITLRNLEDGTLLRFSPFADK